MATFRPVRGVAPLPLRRVAPAQAVVGSVPSHTHTITIQSFTQNYTHRVLGGSRGWWWVHGRERGSGCSGAAQAFSGVQRRWRLEKTRRARLKTPQCAHMGTLDGAQGGSSVTLLPPCKLSCLIIGHQRCPPPSLNLFHCPLLVSLLLFAHCVVIGESVVSLPPLFVIYSELNRHGSDHGMLGSRASATARMPSSTG